MRPCVCPCRYFKREYSALKPFVIISLSYILYTTTDGAIRWGDLQLQEQKQQQ